ncbi:hypothetical protein [Nitrosomonas sp. Nm166]|uniref:hypothetical protein n=1 Tax=Nitrosomonas sp. Nm166 TaxID=1881054 RepID=UPI0008F30A77|nr:hypothetical protein [Nitrosomonas sp. Nm166]SFF22010.1 hypothetical protein SAMN05428977_10747 [Nitrosomonas sp. Nm166]
MYKLSLALYKNFIIFNIIFFSFIANANASGLFADTAQSTCTTPNCQAAIIDKAVILSEQAVSGVASTTPWTGQFFSSGNECIRIEVLETSPANRDLTMHFVGPDLSVWTDDDSGAGLFPRIEANTLVPGRYTVVVGLFAPTVFNNNTRFKLSYGRYPSGNPNCNEPTASTLDQLPDSARGVNKTKSNSNQSPVSE